MVPLSGKLSTFHLDLHKKKKTPSRKIREYKSMQVNPSETEAQRLGLRSCLEMYEIRQPPVPSSQVQKRVPIKHELFRVFVEAKNKRCPA